LEFSKDDLVEIGATGKRVLIIASGQHDDVESTRQMGRVLNQNGSPQSKAVVVKCAHFQKRLVQKYHLDDRLTV
jgi:hypothetical protein